MTNETPKPHRFPNASRLGLTLFFIYSIFYGVFMVWSAFAPMSLGEPLFQGVNTAIVYGMLLIVSAFVLALIYTWFSRKEGKS